MFTVIFTSKSCSHCIDFRGMNGKPTDDKEWSPKMVREILTYSTHLFEINFQTLDNDIDGIIQINEYILHDDKIYRYIYNNKNHSVEFLAEVDGEQDQNIAKENEKRHRANYKDKINNMTYLGWLSLNFPKTLCDLVQFYPFWIFVKEEDWGKSINNQELPCFGVPVSCNIELGQNKKYIITDKERENPMNVLKELSKKL